MHLVLTTKKNLRMNNFIVKTSDPKNHIEACSIIDFFKIKILEDQLGGNDDTFYGKFVLSGDDKSVAIFLTIKGIEVDLI